MTAAPGVRIPQGELNGVETQAELVYPGIRYATTSEVSSSARVLRQLLPGEAPQAGVAAFPQLPGMLDGLLGEALQELRFEEDAFHLAVHAPKHPRAKLPVVVFIHGGGFTTGSGAVRWYSDSALVAGGEALLVTVNYRLGAGAYIQEAGGGQDAPLAELVLALRWVREHIELFGGDPDRITLAGDSAGAWLTYALCGLPETRGWIHRAVLVSLPRIAPHGPRAAEAVRNAFLAARERQAAEKAGITNAGVSRPLAAQAETSQELQSLGFVWRPEVSDAIPEDLARCDRSAARLHVAELLFLRTQEEASAFLRHLPEESFTEAALRQYLADTFMDPEAVQNWCSQGSGSTDPYLLRVWAQTLADFALPIEEVRGSGCVAVVDRVLSLRSPLPRAFSAHCFLLPWVFGNPAHWRDAPMLDGVPEEQAKQVTEEIQAVLRVFLSEGVAGLDAAEGSARWLTPQRVPEGLGFVTKP